LTIVIISKHPSIPGIGYGIATKLTRLQLHRIGEIGIWTNLPR
jgi:hypothetical protein